MSPGSRAGRQPTGSRRRSRCALQSAICWPTAIRSPSSGISTFKGAGQTLTRGTLIKSIRPTAGDLQEIDCRYEGLKGLLLRAEFTRKR